MSVRIRKYPRTRHIQGSRLSPGDEDLSALPIKTIAGQPLVIEEKIDGANAGLRFDEDGSLLLQSRGHFLTGGARERHFNLFKQWANVHAATFRQVLGSRYAVYGEWVYAKHTIFYDKLPHYFMEFDVLDLHEGTFLSTPRRQQLLAELPIVSVPVLHTGSIRRRRDLEQLVTRSLYKTDDWRENLRLAAARGESGRFGKLDKVMEQTDPSDTAEGLYIKLERDGVVEGRFKWVRRSFLTSVVQSQSHWLDRPIVANQLQAGVDIFSGSMT